MGWTKEDLDRTVFPLDTGVVSIGQILAGSANNVISSDAFKGTIRSINPDVRDLLLAEV